MTDTALMTTLDPWRYPLAGGEPPPLSDRLIRALEAHAAASNGSMLNDVEAATDIAASHRVEASAS